MSKATKATRTFDGSKFVDRMKETFRQSMQLLHSWLGLTAGWLLFFVFLTGTTGFVNPEISRWMRPELPLVTKTAAAEALPVAERYLQQNRSGAEFWAIFFPGHHGADALTVTWREPRLEADRAVLDIKTGEHLVQVRPRQTGGGFALYVMHYALHYISRGVAVFIVGAAAMMMLISIVTGVVGHKNLIKGLSPPRTAPAYANWRSRHTLLGVTVLPFFLVMTWSGLMFSLFEYMPVAQAALFPNHEAMTRFNTEAYFPPDRPYGEADIVVPASRTSLSDVLTRAENLWGHGNVSSIRVDHPGGENMRVTAYTWHADIKSQSRVAFDATTGEPIHLVRPRTETAKFYETMIGLHKADFAGTYLRVLYVICGLAGTALVGTGLVHWSTKRKARVNTPRSHAVISLVEKINLATVIGLPIGLAAYFWANRLIPTDVTHRGAWEVHTMFIVWGFAFLLALLRPQRRAWMEMCALAAAAYGLIPILNAITTERHLGITIPAGDWALAGFDLAAFAISAFFLMLAVSIRRKQSVAEVIPGATPGSVTA